MPSSGMAQSKSGDDRPPALFGPIPREKLTDWLAERLARVARVQTLLRIVGSSDSLPDVGEAPVNVRLLKLKDKNSPGEPLGDLVLRPGNRIGLRIKNLAPEPTDVTVLFIDSGFGISTFFPRAAGIDNRLKSTDPALELRATVTAKTVGMEHLLIIGTRPKPNADPSDFSFLSQPTIERARSAGPGGSAARHGTRQAVSTRRLSNRLDSGPRRRRHPGNVPAALQLRVRTVMPMALARIKCRQPAAKPRS